MSKWEISELITDIFIENNFSGRRINELTIEFYPTETTKEEFFIVKILKEEENIHELNKVVEHQFLTNEFFQGIKSSAISKNCSVIYLMEFSTLKGDNGLDSREFDFYDIEESPYYLKKYILPYTQKQLDLFVKEKNQTYADYMTKIIEDKSAYLNLMEDKYIESIYSFVLRIFAKLPFTKYDFTPNPDINEINQQIEIQMEEFGIEDLRHKIYDLFKEYKFDDENLDELRNTVEISEVLIHEQVQAFINTAMEGGKADGNEN